MLPTSCPKSLAIFFITLKLDRKDADTLWIFGTNRWSPVVKGLVWKATGLQRYR